MSVDVMSLFFAMLALGANTVVVAVVVLSVVPALRPLRTRIADSIRGSALGFATIVTGVATAGSLYYSEIAGFPPCSLCWVQRGFMYPLFAVLLLATWRWAAQIVRVARVAALLGAAVSVWHLLVERFPSLEGAVACDPNNPCSLVWVREMGFVTIPYMALAAFLLAAVLLSVRPELQPRSDPSKSSQAVPAPIKERTA